METKAPQYYFLHTGTWSQSVGISASAIEVSFTDEAYGYAQVQKSSENPSITDGNSCYTLAGAVYGVYSSRADALADTNRVDTLTTDETGMTNLSTELRLGIYYIKELSASEGYSICDGTQGDGSDSNGIHTINVAEAGETYTIYCEEKPDNDPVGITLKKIQEDTSFNGVYGDSYLSYLNSYLGDMSGAQFTIKYYDTLAYDSQDELEAAIASGELVENDSWRTWVVQTKALCTECYEYFDDKEACIKHMQEEHGITSNYNIVYRAVLDDEFIMDGSDPLYYNSSGIATLPLGTFTIEETEFAYGYLTDGSYISTNDGTAISDDDGVIFLQVYTNHESNEAVITGGGQLTAHNQPGNEITKIEQLRRCSVTIHKMDDEDEDLEGVEYSLEILNDETGEYEYIASYTGDSYTDENGITVTATDEDGIVKFSNLVYGTYRITETKTVAGMTLLKDSIDFVLPYTSETTEGSNMSTLAYYDEETGLYNWVDITYEITDHPTLEIPQAGGRELAVVAVIGVCAGLMGYMLLKRKKRAIR